MNQHFAQIKAKKNMQSVLDKMASEKKFETINELAKMLGELKT